MFKRTSLNRHSAPKPTFRVVSRVGPGKTFHAAQGLHAAKEGHQDERQETPQKDTAGCGPWGRGSGTRPRVGSCPLFTLRPYIGQVCKVALRADGSHRWGILCEEARSNDIALLRQPLRPGPWEVGGPGGRQPQGRRRLRRGEGFSCAHRTWISGGNWPSSRPTPTPVRNRQAPGSTGGAG